MKNWSWTSAARAWAAAFLALGLGACASGGGGAAPHAAGPIRATEFGQVEGVASADGKTLAWLGVPFAKPPVGALRWQPPRAPDAWPGVRPATDHAEACMQIGGLFGPPPRGKDFRAIAETFYKPIGSEDCLYLNIWSPTKSANGEAKLPVIVFIHGGSNVVGAPFDPLYLGDKLASNANAVVVTVAYRLGVLGWFAHPALNTGDPLRDSGISRCWT